MDILITSASRDLCLKKEIKSLNKFIQYEGEINIHLHEDVIPEREENSKKLIKWANESGYFKTILISNPRKGRGTALNKLKEYAKSEYIIYLEEDWEFIKEINLDYLLLIMDKYEQINQICFYHKELFYVEKPGGPNDKNIFEYINRRFDNCNLFVSDRWNWLPAIWRTSWVKKRWKFKNYTADKEFNRSLKKDVDMNEWDPIWLESKIGAYIYSDNIDCIIPYVRHTSDFDNNRFFDRGFR